MVSIEGALGRGMGWVGGWAMEGEWASGGPEKVNIRGDLYNLQLLKLLVEREKEQQNNASRFKNNGAVDCQGPVKIELRTSARAQVYRNMIECSVGLIINAGC